MSGNFLKVFYPTKLVNPYTHTIRYIQPSGTLFKTALWTYSLLARHNGDGFSLSPPKRQCCRLAGIYNRMAEEQIEEVSGPSSEKGENREFKNDDLGQALDESGLASLLEKQMESDSQPVEPEPEQTTESEAEPEQTEDSVEDAASADEPEAEKSSLTDDDGSEEPEWFQKRIDKLTRQRREAEDEVKDLRDEIKDLRDQVSESANTPVPRSGSTNPFEHLTSQEQINAEKKKARDLRKWCRRNRDGAVVDGKNGEVEYDADQIQDILENAEDALDTHLPERERFVEANAYWEPEAEKAYPWINDRSSNEHKLFNQALKAFPAIQSLPDHKILLGDMLVGRALRMSKETDSKTEAIKKPKAKPKAPKQPAAPSADRTTTPPTAAKVTANKNRFLKSGEESDLADLMMDYV